METMTAFEAAARYPVTARHVPHRPHAATIVTALYIALVLGAPAIIRFAPDADTRWLSAITAGRPHIQCAGVAPAPSPCQAFTVTDAGIHP